ncbi:AAA family ATPase [Mycolicibacterium poriferae]|uniref:AAA family ATPase n=1 Tax=Mycolicibacterium poriferae TaxID=39694 RepID=UPI0024BA7BD8|nr:AAA family ATPase [Mycolicibacterium poriferae]
MSNPFADVDSFETLRAAAMGDDEAFERYRRRESAAARRHVSRVVELQLAARVERMIEVAIASSRAVLLVGPPGTGKTEILEQVIDKADKDPARFGFTSEGIDCAWVTPEEEWTFEKLVLGETVVDGEIRSVEGDLLVAVRNNQWLVLDETNRADMDRVLGGVLTWLSGKRVKVGVWRGPDASGGGGDQTVPVYLEWTDQPQSRVREVDTPPSLEYAAGSEWRVLGTYNAVDAQRVFRMGQALSRRFKHVPVPPASTDDFRAIIAGRVDDEKLLDWLTDRVPRLYSAHLGIEDAQLGPGLFVDIPAYVEHGLRMHTYSNTAGDGTIAGDGATTTGPEGGAQGSEDDGDGEPAESEPKAKEQAPTHPDELFEELLAEAYLVSVGNLVAKYEPDLLDDLSVAITSAAALTAGNWTWVQQSLHAMRA